MPVSLLTLAGFAVVWLRALAEEARAGTPGQEELQLAHGTPGRKFLPMQASLVSRKAKVSPTASPEAASEAAPPVLLSMPWPHSWRKTAAISPVFEQPPPER